MRTKLPLTVSGWRQLVTGDHATLVAADSFLREHGLLTDQDTIARADNLLRVGEPTERLLDLALTEAGYRLVDSSRSLNEGEARFINGHLEIFFRKAIYPHNIFCSLGRWLLRVCRLSGQVRARRHYVELCAADPHR